MDSRLAARLARVPLLADLDAGDLAAIDGQFSVRTVPRGQTMVREGEAGDGLHVLVTGAADVVLGADTPAEQLVATLGPGDVVGEIGAVAGSPRAATVRARRTVTAIACTSAGVQALLARRPDIGAELTRIARERIRVTALTGHLMRLLDEPPADAVQALVEAATWVDLEPGARLFSEGDPADAAYVVVSGRLRAHTHGPEDRVDVRGDIGRGELVGEIALLDPGAVRSASVVALRTSELARIERTAFERVVADHAAALLPVARTIVTRARQPVRQDPPVAIVIGVLPTSSGVDAAGIAAGIGRTLRRHGSVLVADRATVLGRLGEDATLDAPPDTPAGLRIDRWLHQTEMEHDTVVYVADAEPTAWSRRIAGRVDELVLAADATDKPGPTPVEAVLSGGGSLGGPTVTLALVQDPTVVLPTGTPAWLEARHVDRHVHLRSGTDDDVARLARLVAGRPVCVALSGGGARGLAHLGALAELESAGIPIDVLAGSSVGGGLAVTWAMSREYVAAVELATKAFAGVVDYTLPVASIASARRLSANIREQAGTMGLEDAWLPLLITTTDLTAARAVHHDRGRMDALVRATVSIPGVFPPVAIDGHQHVDGGVMDNLPMVALRERHRGATIIAVDVAPPRGPSAKDQWDLGISGWGLAARRMVPGLRAPRVPGVMGSILAAQVVAASADRDRALAEGVADAYLHLGIRGYGLLEFDNVREIAGAGREAAAPLIEEWLTHHERAW